MASLETRPKSFRVVWYEDGEKQAMTFHDGAEAVRFRKLVEGSGNRWPAGWQKPQRGAPLPPTGKLTFRAWAEKAITHRTHATPRTRSDYLRDLENHFGLLNTLPLDEIGAEDVTLWLGDRHDADLAPKTIRNLHGFASSLFVQALAQHPPLVQWNPFVGRLPDHASVKVEEMVFLTPQEAAFLLRYVRAEYLGLIRFLFGTGLRFGEATALTVGDVDLLGRRKALTVTKAWKRVGTAEWMVGEPKTKRSRRTLALSHELVLLLAEATAGKRGSELVFSRPDGARLPHTEVWKRGWAPAVGRANVCDVHYAPQRDGRGKRPTMPEPCDCAGTLGKVPRIHDARHSHISWLIADGHDLASISKRVGHSSTKVTTDRYGHLDPRVDDAINASVDRALAVSGVLDQADDEPSRLGR